ncbi:MAG TPA: hypothetical protein VN901_23045 [Candidatus Acidoferrales bacterium]|nr:hypothetical protein [Candidatus Acidoferrales bacterium]
MSAAGRAHARPIFFARLINRQSTALVAESLLALWHSHTGIVASGTATVEAATMQTPFIIAYCASSLTSYLLDKLRLKVPHFSMVNLFAGEQVFPELVQHDFTAADVVARLREILPDGPSRSRMLDGLVKVKARLGASESAVEGLEQTPADRPAEIYLSIRNRRIANEEPDLEFMHQIWITREQITSRAAGGVAILRVAQDFA